MSNSVWFSGCLKRVIWGVNAVLLSACSLVAYQPTQTIDRVRKDEGYRLEQSIQRSNQDNTLVIMMFSGGGTRAAALAYGVLAAFNDYPMMLNGRRTTLTASSDVVFGVSGGSVLAAYYAMHGEQVIPRFEERFLKQNFQRLMFKQALSFSNMPRLASPEYGRGDLLQEQFENTLFGNMTFGDLNKYRRGPFAVISATDMASGQRIDFTQENFDQFCLNLSDLRVARAVASSSAVPVIFSPLTLNNNSGNCGYTVPARFQVALDHDADALQQKTRREMLHNAYYADSKARPFLHLVDGGLTDNLGLRSLLDRQEIYPNSSLQAMLEAKNINRVIVVSVNAQNQISETISQQAKIPSFRDMINATIDVPIARASQESLRQFRAMVDAWNASQKDADKPIRMHFVSLSLHDLPPSSLRTRALNIPTTYYLPRESINDLKEAAKILVKQSPEFQQLRQEAGQPETPQAAAAAQQENIH